MRNEKFIHTGKDESWECSRTQCWHVSVTLSCCCCCCFWGAVVRVSCPCVWSHLIWSRGDGDFIQILRWLVDGGFVCCWWIYCVILIKHRSQPWEAYNHHQRATTTAPADDDPLGVPSSSRPRPLTQRHRCFCSVAVNCQPLNFERAFADAFLFALSTQMGWEKGWARCCPDSSGCHQHQPAPGATHPMQQGGGRWMYVD